MAKTVKIGVLSDTHGELPVKVLQIFQDVDYIIHAGDIGDSDILLTLKALAPTLAVYGNTDGFDVRKRVPVFDRIDLDGFRIEVTHVPFMSWAGTNPEKTIRIFGHTHIPKVEKYASLWIVNPGSASRPKSGRKPSVAFIVIAPDQEPNITIEYL